MGGSLPWAVRWPRGESKGDDSVVPAGRPAGAPKALPEGNAGQPVTPHDVALLAHELRRRMAAMRVLGEAVSLLHGQGLDPGAMLERLMVELDDLDDLAAAVLGDAPTGTVSGCSWSAASWTTPAGAGRSGNAEAAGRWSGSACRSGRGR